MMGMDDVLVAKMVSGGLMDSRWANNSCLTVNFSMIASMIKVAFNRFLSVVVESNSKAWLALSWVIFPFSTAMDNCFCMCNNPFSRDWLFRSNRRVGYPDWIAQRAIPEPITPAPITAMVCMFTNITIGKGKVYLPRNQFCGFCFS